MPPPKEDPTNSTKILLTHWDPYKTKENEHFRGVALRQSVTGAKWVMVSPRDSMRATFKNHWESLCFCIPPPKEDLTNSTKSY